MASLTPDPQAVIAALCDELPPDAAPEQVVAQVERAFEALGSEADAAGQQRFMPGLERAYGVRVPHLRTIAAHVARVLKRDPERCRAVALASWPRGAREHRLFACFLVERVKLPPAACWELGAGWLPDVQTWEDCDQLCGVTLGRALAADPAYMDTLAGWTSDPRLWWRRAALVSTVYLRRSKLPPDVLHSLDERALGLCAALRDDGEPYIRKAVDWAVREVIERHYALGRDWMLAQAAGGLSRTAQTTLKLSAKKLNEADREAFLEILAA
ncbi:MAG: DNA alkylation repair protein [Anaerolineae bacterium]|nr:DNA alkylation repair protein [Anaerolineae bacterium]